MRELLRHQGPKARRVVELFKVAQLVHYYIRLERGGQLDDAIVKPQVAAARAAPPPRAGVADKYFVVDKAVAWAVVRKQLGHPCAGRGRELFKLSFTFSTRNSPAPDPSYSPLH